MRGGTHAMAGVLIALTMTPHMQPLDGLPVVLAGAVGALLPDLDHPKSAISRRVWLLGASARMFVAHRGALHSLLAVAVAAAAVMLIPVQWRIYGYAAAAGYASHVFLDMLTVSGVPLLWPRKRRIRLLRLRTGGVGESVVLCLLVAALVATVARR